MENWIAQVHGNECDLDPHNKAIELLDRYGPSHFVDAIQVSRFNQVFRRRLNIPAEVDESFWDQVSSNLKESICEAKI